MALPQAQSARLWHKMHTAIELRYDYVLRQPRCCRDYGRRFAARRCRRLHVTNAVVIAAFARHIITIRASSHMLLPFFCNIRQPHADTRDSYYSAPDTRRC